MYQRKRLIETLGGGVSDRPVWTADISYWIDGNEKTELQSESGYLDFCADLGCMPYYWYDAFWAGERRFDDCVSVSRRSLSDGSDDRINEFKTEWRMGGRSLTKIDRYSQTSWSEATIKHPIESISDLTLLIDLIEASSLLPSSTLESYRVRRERWNAYDGIPCIGLPRSPMSAFINEWCGVENGILLYYDAPELCKRLFISLEEAEQAILEACVKCNVELVHFPDNLTSEVYTSIFDETIRETYERRLSTLRTGGVRAAVHLDGTVRGLLPKLCATGIDAVEAVTPSPVGDCDPAEMRTIATDSETVLWGGVPGAMFARPYTWLDMKRHVESLLDSWRGSPFVLGVADQVPPDGDIETVRRIADLLDR